MTEQYWGIDPPDEPPRDFILKDQNIHAFHCDELTEDGTQVYYLHSLSPNNRMVLKGTILDGEITLVSQQCWNCGKAIGLCICNPEPNWSYYF